MTAGDSEPSGDPSEVAATYDRIAPHFARTREYPWPEVESFLDGRTAAVALDLGCGNGRHAEVLAGLADRVVGVDVSAGLLREARERAVDRGYEDAFDAVLGDSTTLPLRDRTVDVAVYVAALHHVGEREGRVRSLSELNRVLARDGRALVSAWSTESDRFEGEARRTSEGRAGEAREEGFDTTVDWTLPGGRTVPRFYHIYHPAEFRADLDSSGLRTVEAFVSSGNCYAVVAPA